MIDEGYAYDVSHPFHIHGHSFYVVASERHGGAPEHIGAAPHPKNFVTREYVEELNRSGKIKKNLINPPLKDNVAVPDAGFTILRFVADNVGYWLFHCHMSWHNHLGMGLIFKVCTLLGIVLQVFPMFYAKLQGDQIKICLLLKTMHFCSDHGKQTAVNVTNTFWLATKGSEMCIFFLSLYFNV